MGKHQNFTKVLEQVLKLKTEVHAVKNLSGGCINNAALITTGKGPFFMKWNHQEKHEMFLAESKGLALLKRHSQFVVPEVLGCGIVENKSYLILEFIESAPTDQGYWVTMGRNLAGLHRNRSDSFGLSHHNYIGSLHQNNSAKGNWIDFFIENRLEAQLQLALNNGLITMEYMLGFRKVYDRFEDIFPSAQPSLLHGDLWSGNVMVASNGMPVLIDPATYYGHREIEIAFTRLFGGFDQAFYASYQEAYPMETGFDRRVDLYNLYPLLVHLNLFGPSYLAGIDRTIRKFS